MEQNLLESAHNIISNTDWLALDHDRDNVSTDRLEDAAIEWLSEYEIWTEVEFEEDLLKDACALISSVNWRVVGSARFNEALNWLRSYETRPSKGPLSAVETVNAYLDKEEGEEE